METLQTYLDGLFKAVPDTPKTRKAKQDLLDLMTDHYHAELASGKGPAEALGLVISEFGDVDEVMDALEVDQPLTGAPTADQASHGGAIALNEDAAEGFWAGTDRFAKLLSLGIALIIAGLGFTALLSTQGGPLAAVAFLVCTGLGVGLIIAASMGYRDISRPVRHAPVTAATQALAQSQANAYNRPHSIGLVGGILMCIGSLVPPILSNYGDFTGDEAGAAFFLFVAIGVYFLVYTGIVASGFSRLARAKVAAASVDAPADDWTEDGEATAATARDRQTATFAAPRHGGVLPHDLAGLQPFYWPVLTTAFLFFGFIAETWSLAIFILIVGSLFEKPLFGKRK
ncbi:permease prefix domain 1-containing protein [Lacticaseibacillus parakribbianus]|uniref:permease prefix domain 1-containing protein n=1 Tax=Lacticaseibacillus parakribbianus TaxID=2970927 RepID=UPI0021CAE746|nr:permease prefix domain 1-containing protein [Lacticaseibacillus parakribbianus]